jgi:SAM-dependent methyltransferase
MSPYMLDNTWQRAGERLALLEAWLDPGTKRRLEALGVGSGWRCLEAGAGGGSIAAWLCRRVGAAGSVLATDIDTRLLEGLGEPNLDVLRHDVTAEALPEGVFDLIHTRLLLTHLADRDAVLRRIVRALRPGGRLLVEEGDWSDWEPAPGTPAGPAWRFRRHWHMHDRFSAARGVDHRYGQQLPAALERAGVVCVESERRATELRGGSHEARFWRLSFAQVGEAQVAEGLIDPDELGAYLEQLDDPGFTWTGMTLVAAWGRRPPSAGGAYPF